MGGETAVRCCTQPLAANSPAISTLARGHAESVRQAVAEGAPCPRCGWPRTIRGTLLQGGPSGSDDRLALTSQGDATADHQQEQ